MKSVMFYGNRIDPSPQDKNTLETHQFEPTLNFWTSRKKLAVFELFLFPQNKTYPVVTK